MAKVHSPILAANRRRQISAPATFPTAAPVVIGPVKLLTVAAGSGAGTLWNWGYSFADGAGGWSDAGAFVALGPCSVMPGTNATAGDHGVLLQVMQNNSAGTAISLMFQPIINSTVGPSTGGSTLLYSKTTSSETITGNGYFGSFATGLSLQAGDVLRVQASGLISDTVAANDGFTVIIGGTPAHGAQGGFPNIFGQIGWKMDCEVTVMGVGNGTLALTGHTVVILAGPYPLSDLSLNTIPTSANFTAGTNTLGLLYGGTGTVTLNAFTVERLRP